MGGPAVFHCSGASAHYKISYADKWIGESAVVSKQGSLE